MNTNANLSPEQIAAHNKAVDMYVLSNAKRFGGFRNHPVIVIPEFEEDTTTGEWFPVESNGSRLTKKEGLLFLRLGMPTLSGLDVRVMKHNEFIEDAKFDLLVEMLDLKIGDAIPDQVLTIQESLTPFNSKNPERDLKYAGNTGIPCTFTGEVNGVQYDTPAPIYRRVKLAPVGTNNVLIAHTNKDEISKFQSAAWNALNKTAIPEQAKNLRTAKK